MLLEQIAAIDTLLSNCSASEQDILRNLRETCFVELDKLNREACETITPYRSALLSLEEHETSMLVPWRLLRRCEYLVEILMSKPIAAVSSETLREMLDELRKVQGKPATERDVENTISHLSLYGHGTKSDVNFDGLVTPITGAELKQRLADTVPCSDEHVEQRFKAPTREEAELACAHCITPVDCEQCKFNNGAEAGGC